MFYGESSSLGQDYSTSQYSSPLSRWRSEGSEEGRFLSEVVWPGRRRPTTGQREKDTWKGSLSKAPSQPHHYSLFLDSNVTRHINMSLIIIQKTSRGRWAPSRRPLDSRSRDIYPSRLGGFGHMKGTKLYWFQTHMSLPSQRSSWSRVRNKKLPWRKGLRPQVGSIWGQLITFTVWLHAVLSKK